MTTPIIGIDLGTTYSAISTINVAGKPEIIANADYERTTASAILFESKTKTTVGQKAIDANEPNHLARWFKREMGNSNYKKHFFGQDYSAVDLSAMVLAKVVQDAEVSAGKIDRAVITVPAYFDEIRRKATMDAAELAGIEVLRIINEPTAAALAYATSGKIRGRVLVYDFGGGTFDASVVDIHDEYNVQALATEGDEHLGGVDLDRALAVHLNEQFQAKHGISLVTTTLSNHTLTPDEHALLGAAEQIKRTLSGREHVLNHPIISSTGVNETMSVTREEFNSLISRYINQTELCVDIVLEEAQTTPDEIDATLLVGGSARIPAVQEMLEKKFKQLPEKFIPPDEAVTLGAAIQASQILAAEGSTSLPAPIEEALAQSSFKDVTSKGYGTFAVASNHGVDRKRNFILIPKNSPIPCKKSESFATLSDGQTFVDCSITTGDETDPEFVETIWEGMLELPAGRPAGCEILAVYRYDENQRMSATFTDVASGRTKNVDLDMQDHNNPDVVPSIADSIFNDLVIE